MWKNLSRLLSAPRFCGNAVGTRCVSTEFSSRTHNCGELRLEHEGEKVKLSGWVQFLRLDKFLILRDAHGTVQCIVPETNSGLWSRINEFPLESVVSVRGEVIRRPQGQENPKIGTGAIEISLEEIEDVSPAAQKLPFFPGRDHNKVKEETAMRHRFLALRDSRLQANLRLRSKVTAKIRNFLVSHDFVDVETPALFRRTPGGAREFVVPTHLPGQFYSLVQSPQQFKQLLMVGGLERYFQVAKCFRDEGSRPDRQPEFTQVDIELSFTSKEHIQDLIEGLVLEAWPDHLPKVTAPFPRITHEDAMKLYGSDKPDLRFDNRIQDVSDCFRGDPILGDRLEDGSVVNCVKFDAKNKDGVSKIMKNIESIAKKRHPGLIVSQFKHNEDGGLKSPLLKKCSEDSRELFQKQADLADGDIGFVVCGSEKVALSACGAIRTELAANLLDLDPLDFKLCWVEEFPLFEREEDGSISSSHHPFTQPDPRDLHLLDSDPCEVRGLHYDLVLNGQEIAGGSIRIHDPVLQRKVISDILKEDSSELEHLIEALGFGCPPHGGIAIGLDRLMAILTQSKSIRDVIAFPKTADGRDLMGDAPAQITKQEQDYYHIKTVNKT